MKRIFCFAIILSLFSVFSFAEINSYVQTDFSTDLFYSFNEPKKEVFSYSQGIDFGIGGESNFAEIGAKYFIPFSAYIDSSNVKDSPCYGFEFSAAYKRDFSLKKMIFPLSAGLCYRYYELTGDSFYKNYLCGIFIKPAIKKAINEELYCSVSLNISYFPFSVLKADSNDKCYSDFAISPSFVIGGFLF